MVTITDYPGVMAPQNFKDGAEGGGGLLFGDVGEGELRSRELVAVGCHASGRIVAESFGRAEGDDYSLQAWQGGVEPAQVAGERLCKLPA